MASPLVIYVSPNMGLEIEITDFKDIEVEFDPKDNSTSRKYRITNLEMFDEFMSIPEESAEEYYGKLSPLFDVTLPPAAKQTAGIPLEARYFGFMHPPNNLGKLVDWEKFVEDRTDFKDMYQFSFTARGSIDQSTTRGIREVNQLDVVNICILGAFVYFDKHFKLLSVNALTFRKTKYELSLSGPFKMAEYAATSLLDLKRVDVLRRELFHEAGFVGLSWIRSNEMFGNAPVTAEYTNNHGGFGFFSETGTALFYGIDFRKHVDSSGLTGAVADCFKTSQDDYFVKRLKLRFDDHDEVTKTIEERFKLFVLQEPERDGRLLTQYDCATDQRDITSWNALHYACCYSPKDSDLIASIMEKKKHFVNQPDSFGRYPLHVALSSGASEEVIKKLLSTDQSKKVVRKSTNNLKMLPIHVACSNGASATIINELIEADNYPPGLLDREGADERGRTVMTTSLVGRLPLHAAIEGSCSYEAIRLLLLAYSTRLKQFSKEEQGDIEEDIYRPFRGMYPLHLLAWKNCPAQTVRLVLKKDSENSMIDIPIQVDYFLYGRHDVQQLRSSYVNAQSGSIYKTMVTVDSTTKSGILPLHLALRHRSYEVVRLLLKKEKEKDRQFGEETTVLATDQNTGKCALHLACSYKPDFHIIRMLLEMDPMKETTVRVDNEGFMPIHHATEDKNLKLQTLEALLEDEDEYRASFQRRNDENLPKKSTHHLDVRNRIPLHHAIESGLPTEIIDVLLTPEHFCLKGFDVEAVQELAKKVASNPVLQERVIDRISQRDHSAFLFLELYTYIVAVITFMVASNDLVHQELNKAEPVILTICGGIFLFRELGQAITQRGEYLGDIWSLLDVASVIALAVTVVDMFTHVGSLEYDPSLTWRINYTIAGSLLVLQFIFFLRATFIPFARFVGGLLLIFYTLVPFFIVGGLLLLIFAYGFFMLPTEHEDMTCDSLSPCYKWVLKGVIYGNENMESFFDLIFGIVAIIVLLNVVIAIVSEAWVDATAKAEYLFWLYRINWITEIQGLRKVFDIITEKFNFVDKIGDIRVRDSVTWTEEPYSVVKKKEEYDDPYYHFPPNLAEDIMKGHSLQADLYWTHRDCEQKKFTASQRMSAKFGVILRFFFMALIYLILIVLGLCTFGLMWPSNFRRWFLSLGLRDLAKMKDTENEEENDAEA